MARAAEARYRNDYPSLFGLLTTSLPALPKMQPRVFRTFLRYTGLSRTNGLVAVLYGFGPVIHVPQYEVQKYANYPGSGDEINVHWNFLTDVETAHQTGFTGALALLESKILHEMVHWGWYTVNQSIYEPRSKYGYTDFAWDFEHDAYGRPQTVYSTGLSHVIPDPLLPRP